MLVNSPFTPQQLTFHASPPGLQRPHSHIAPVPTHLPTYFCLTYHSLASTPTSQSIHPHPSAPTTSTHPPTGLSQPTHPSPHQVSRPSTHRQLSTCTHPTIRPASHPHLAPAPTTLSCHYAWNVLGGGTHCPRVRPDPRISIVEQGGVTRRAYEQD